MIACMPVYICSILEKLLVVLQCIYVKVFCKAEEMKKEVFPPELYDFWKLVVEFANMNSFCC